MPRDRPLSDDELYEAALDLRKIRPLARFRARVVDWLDKLIGAKGSYFWEVSTGRLELAQIGLKSPELLPQLEYYYGTLRPFDPVKIRNMGQQVHHTSVVFDLSAKSDGAMLDFYRHLLHRIGCDQMLGAYVFDGALFAGLAGVSQPWGEPDFTDHDLSAFRTIYPHIEVGYKQAKAHTVAQRFGDAIATVLAHHPRPIFLFETESLTPLYCNDAALLLLQKEGGSVDKNRIPLVQHSELMAEMRTSVQCKPQIKLDEGFFDVIPLEHFPGLERRAYRLVLGRQADDQVESGSLTQRQRDLLAQFRAGGSVEEVAENLGITVPTVRTHLRNTYRRLGVDSLSEALVVATLNEPGDCSGVKENV